MQSNRRPRSRRTLTKLVVAVVVVAVVAVGVKAWISHNAKAALVTRTSPGARNSQRRSELKTLAAAISSYQQATPANPALPIPANQTGICSSTGQVCKMAGLVDLTVLSSRGYILGLPNDPVGGHSLYGTGYDIGRAANGGIELSAPRAEDGATITQTVH